MQADGAPGATTADDDEIGAWIRRSAASHAAAGEAAQRRPDHAGREVARLVAAAVIAVAVVLLLWAPTFVVFDRLGTRAWTVDAWHKTSVDMFGPTPGRVGGAEGYGPYGWVVLLFVVPFVVLVADDLRRIAANRPPAWVTHRVVLASCLLGWCTFLGLTAYGYTSGSLALPGVVAQIVAAVLLVVVVVAEPHPSDRRLVGIALALFAGALAVSTLVALDDAGRAAICASVTDGRSACTAVRRTLVHGVWVDGLLWAAGAVVLLVAVRRWARRAPSPDGPRPTTRRAALVACVAFVALVPVISVAAETAVVRDWCSDAPVVKTFTRPAGCTLRR